MPTVRVTLRVTGAIKANSTAEMPRLLVRQIRHTLSNFASLSGKLAPPFGE